MHFGNDLSLRKRMIPGLALGGLSGARGAVAKWLVAAQLVLVAAICRAEGIAREDAEAVDFREVREDSPALPDALWLCTKEDGYRGIWYWNQKQEDEYVYKYAGGLGTYCAHHYPFAVYCPEVEKTFFCYGGALKDRNELVHMISYFDHRTGQVPRPTALLNKKTDDAHDNPVLAVDGQGYIWIFSSAHGRARRAYISVSKEPYSIDDFTLVEVTNFSYPQVYWVEDRGIAFFHTRYLRGHRCLFFTTSEDGRTWGELVMLAYVRQGHYQVSAVGKRKIATAFNYHPHPGGLNYRTNLYYMESDDFGRTWRAADGTPLCLPLTEIVNDALVHDYESENLRVYLVDMILDDEDRPVIVYILSRGWEAGPQNDPRIWHTARWDGNRWVIRPAMVSDNNYDNGSIYIERDGRWILVAPTEPGPQPYNTGGEVVLWQSSDQGATWQKLCELTKDSLYNHGYCRRPVRVHPQFYSFWADGHGRQPSESRLYFCDRQGNVYRLPPHMESDFALPELVHLAADCPMSVHPAGSNPHAPVDKLAASSASPGEAAEGDVAKAGGCQAEVAPGSVDENDTGTAPPPAVPRFLAIDRLPALPTEAAWPNTLPSQYLEKVALVPDLCQTDPLFADLPQGGRSLCGPTAFVNILLALSAGSHGADGSAGGDQSARALELLELLVDRYLLVTPEGISPLRAMEGIERYLADHGYQSRIEWRGWRRGGRFATSQEIDPDWLCRSILGHSWAILNVGWYRRNPAGDLYQRFGGHWVTLVGYRKAGDDLLLLVHDPARRSGAGKVTHEVRLCRIEQGDLAPWGGYGRRSARGIFRLEGLVLHPQADCALLDGAIRMEITGPEVSVAGGTSPAAP